MGTYLLLLSNSQSTLTARLVLPVSFSTDFVLSLALRQLAKELEVWLAVIVASGQTWKLSDIVPCVPGHAYSETTLGPLDVLDRSGRQFLPDVVGADSYP